MARRVRVSTIAYDPPKGSKNHVEEARYRMVSLADEAARAKPDIICFPEVSTTFGLSCEASMKEAEPVPGPTTDLLGAKAKEHNMYIVCPLIERCNGIYFNSAVLIGRRGEIVGVYHKYYPTVLEIESGITPGTEFTVLDTDIGRVGLSICFDLNFYDVADGLAEKEAEIVFWPSMYQGGFQHVVWATQYGMYMVSSYRGYSAIYDLTGVVLAETGYTFEAVAKGSIPPIASAEINMDRKLLHLDFNKEKFGAMTRKYGPKITIDILEPEDIFALGSEMDDVSVDDLIREFNLEHRSDYFERSKKARREALARAEYAPAVS